MANILLSDPVKRLEVLLEEATRSTKKNVALFVEPGEGTLRRALSRQHHIVFGRRGSGKSSLLRKAATEATISRRPLAYVDLETFKGHSYPDVLLSVLIQSFRSFSDWLGTAAVYPANRTSFWKKWLGAPKAKPFNKETAKKLQNDLDAQVKELEQLLHGPDDLDTETNLKRSHDTENGASLKAGVRVEGVEAGISDDERKRSSAAVEVKQKFVAKKTDFLQRHILVYQRIFQQMLELADGDSFLFLDDLYHIRKADQAQVLDYFHRIAKNNGLWLKVGTIRHRSRWYRHGDPPIGLKIGDDAEDIDLDLTLEKFETTKAFLRQLLEAFIAQCKPLTLTNLLVSGALDRLVLASGGVARDFLGIFRGSIRVARERGGGHRGEKIGTEDVNNAAGEYESKKNEELQRDTLGEQETLESEFKGISDFCKIQAKSNVFLLDKANSSESLFGTVQELVDLRLLHKVRSRVTVSGRKGAIYEAYMLDVSQYTASRKMRELEIIDFWLPEAQERLRRASLIYHHNEIT
jgi:hypothetical protein